MKPWQALSYLVANPRQGMRYLRNRLAEARAHLPGRERAWLPTVIYLAVNSRCNLRCRMCDVGTGTSGTPFHDKLAGRQTEMDLAGLRDFLRQVAPFRPLISITSTEPLLYQGLPEALAQAKNLGLEVSLTTNGYLLPAWASKLVEAGLDHLSISLDGPAEVHNRIRGVANSFERAMEGLTLVEEARRNRGQTTPTISINTTVMGENARHLLDLSQRLDGHGVSLHTISHLNFVNEEMAQAHNRSFAHLGPSRPSCMTHFDLAAMDLDSLWQQLGEVRKRSRAPVLFTPDLAGPTELRDYYFDPFKRFGRPTCYIPFKHAQVLADGQLTVLTRCFYVSFGNVFERPFTQLWNGDPLRTFRRALVEQGPFPACLRCCGLF